MFNLIITIISIALVVATAAASIYYGGQAFNQGQAKAGAATLSNVGNQITAAQELYRIDHQGSRAAIEDLVAGNYTTLNMYSLPDSLYGEFPGFPEFGVLKLPPQLVNTDMCVGSCFLAGDAVSGYHMAGDYVLGGWMYAMNIKASVCAVVNENAGHPGLEVSTPSADLYAQVNYLHTYGISEGCLMVNLPVNGVLIPIPTWYFHVS